MTRILIFGAEDEARTRDPNLGKVMLYQLSYFRIIFKNYCHIVGDCYSHLGLQM